MKLFLYFLGAILGGGYFVAIGEKTGTNILMIILNYTVMVSFFAFGWLKFKNIINPISLLFPLFLGFFYYQFMFSSRQSTLEVSTIYCFYLFVVFYAFGTFLKFKSFVPQFEYLTNNQLITTHFILITAICVFLFESFMNGGFPLLLAIIYKQEIYADMYALPILHYFVMLAALLPGVYYYFFKKGFIKKQFLCIATLICVFILLNTLSRQIMILGIITFFFLYVSVNKIAIDKLLFRAGGGGIFLFFIIGAIRIGSMDAEVGVADYLKLYSDISPSLDINIFDITFNLYAALNFDTLNTFIKDSPSYSYGLYTFRPIIELFKYDVAFSLFYDDKFNGFVNLATIISDPYLDFGYVGVTCMAFIYGVTVSIGYRTYLKSSNLGSSIVWSTLVYVMIMAVFANFFNILFIWICLGYGILMSGKFAIKNQAV